MQALVRLCTVWVGTVRFGAVCYGNYLDSFTLKMKAAQFFKAMGANCPAAQCRIPQDLQQQHCCLKLKSNTYFCCILFTHFTFPNLKVEAACSSKLFQPVCQIKWHGITLERNVGTYCHGSLKSYKPFYSNSRFVSLVHVRDTSKHVILSTQKYKPNEFASRYH
jgi:hypothetical protein